MPGSSKAKQPGDPARVKRPGVNGGAVENDWTLVRFEPRSGNAVAEKAGKRVIVPQAEFAALNFPGSDLLWNLVEAADLEECLAQAKTAWLNADLPGVFSSLMKHAREMDPAFAGVQTLDDLVKKAQAEEDACRSSLEVLRIDVTRSEREYNQYLARTPLENDTKDNLLARWRSLEDQYAARKHQCEKLIPAWHRVAAALQALVKASSVTPVKTGVQSVLGDRNDQ